MATPPTWVTAYTTLPGNNTSPKSTGAVVSGSAGDVICGTSVMWSDSGNDNHTITSSPAETWTEGTETGGLTASDVWMQPVSTVLTAARSGMTITDTKTVGDAPTAYGFVLGKFTATDGVGATAASTGAGQSAPSLTITTLYDNSAIFYVVGDWSDDSNAARTHRTPSGGSTPVEVGHFNNSTEGSCTWAYVADAGTAGAKVVGMSAPTGRDSHIIAIEVRGTSVAPWDQTGYVVQEDGTSKIQLEDGSGFLVGEAYAGTPPNAGAVAADFNFDAAVVGTRASNGAVPADFRFDAAAVSTTPHSGAVLADFTFNAAVVGTRSSRGLVAADFNFNAAVVGQQPPNVGAVSADFRFDAAVVGTRTSGSVISADFRFDAAVVGTRTSRGLVSADFRFDAAVVSTTLHRGLVAADFTFNAAVVSNTPHRGVVLADFTFNAAVVGNTPHRGVVPADFRFDAAVVGDAPPEPGAGAVNADFSLNVVVTGTRPPDPPASVGAVSADHRWTVVVASNTPHKAVVTADFRFDAAVAGTRPADPLPSVGSVTANHQWNVAVQGVRPADPLPSQGGATLDHTWTASVRGYSTNPIPEGAIVLDYLWDVQVRGGSAPAPIVPTNPIEIVLDELSVCLCAQILTDGLPPVCVCGVMPGAGVALDYAGDCDDACGMAWVRLVAAYPSVSTGSATESLGNCSVGIGMDIEIGIVRCISVGDGQAVDPDDLAAATRLQVADILAIWRAVACCRQSSDWILGAMTPYGPEGGVVGTTVTLSIGPL